MGRLLKGLAFLLVVENSFLYETELPDHFRIPVEGKRASLKCIVEVNEDQNQVLFYVMVRIAVPPAKRHDIDYYVNRVNAQRTIGSFDFDIDAGLVAYRAGVEIAEMSLTTPQIASLLRSPLTHAVTMADRYGPGISDIVDANTPPIRALEKIDDYALV